MGDNEILRRDAATTVLTVPAGMKHIFKLRPLLAHRLEVADFHFHHNSCVLLPEFDPETSAIGARPGNSDEAGATAAPVFDLDPAAPAAPNTTGLDAIRASFVHAKEKPERKILICGHTDTTGQKGPNVTLAGQRAENVQTMLEGMRDNWVKNVLKKNKVEDYQHILKWISVLLEWPCDPGKVDNDHGSGTTKAVKAFQKRYNKTFSGSIPENGVVEKQTWGAFFDVYEEVIADSLDTERGGLRPYRDSLQFLKADWQGVGCGEHFPIDARAKDEYKSATNRRVEILFFDPGEEPKLDCHPKADACVPAQCELYNGITYRHRPLPIPKTTPLALTAKLTEVKGLYKPGHKDPADEAAGKVKRSGYLKGYTGADDKGRIMINHIPREDASVDWQALWKKDTQYIELTVEFEPKGAKIPVYATALWEWQDPDDPFNQRGDVRKDAGAEIDPGDYPDGKPVAASGGDNSGKCDFPKKDAGQEAAWEEIAPYSLTKHAGTKLCETNIVGGVSKVRLHVTNVGGDNFKVRVRAMKRFRVDSAGEAATGVMTMWKRIDVEYRKMEDALDLPVADIPVPFETACVQMDITGPLPTPKREFLGDTEKQMYKEAEKLVTKAGAFENEGKPGWFLLVAAHQAAKDVGAATSRRLYRGTAEVKPMDYNNGKGEILILPVNITDDVQTVVLREGSNGVNRRVFRKEENKPTKGQCRLHYEGLDYQSEFVPGTGFIGLPGQGGAHDRTDEYYANSKISYPGDKRTPGGFGFGTTVNLTVHSPGSRAVGGISPGVVKGGKEYFAGRTIIFTKHRAYFSFAKGKVTIGGTFAAGETITVTVDGAAATHTVAAGEDASAIATALSAAITAGPAQDRVRAEPDEEAVVILALEAGESKNGLTYEAKTDSPTGKLTPEGKALAGGGRNDPSLMSTIVHEFGHAFGFPHKCGYHTWQSPEGKSCCMNYGETWLYKPGTRELERWMTGKRNENFCPRHLNGIRRVSLENNPAMWTWP